jgi:hypothetical protein
LKKTTSTVATVLIGVMLLAPGCTKKYVARVAPFERGSDDCIVRTAPRSGLYHVRFVENRKPIKDAGAAPAVDLRKGEPCGFREDEDGNLIGIAGPNQIDVIGAPERATHVVWYHRSKQPTQFAKNMNKVGEVMQAVLITTAIGAGAVAVGALYLEARECACDEHPCKHQRKRGRR